MDRIVERALTTRSTQVVRRLDPALEPRLAALIPDARNLLIVPLFLAGGFRLGVLVVEGVGRGDTISGWTVEIIQQFASHAAVRLHNAWLLDDNRRKLGEIQRLKDELMVKNLSLESTVIERTVELDARLEQLRGAEAERERLLSHLLSAQEDERRRIAGTSTTIRSSCSSPSRCAWISSGVSWATRPRWSTSPNFASGSARRWPSCAI
jgi:GAF domain-containing protein